MATFPKSLYFLLITGRGQAAGAGAREIRALPPALEVPS